MPFHYFVLAWQYTLAFTFPVYALYFVLKKLYIKANAYYKNLLKTNNRQNIKNLIVEKNEKKKKILSRKAFFKKSADWAFDLMPFVITTGAYGTMMLNKEHFTVVENKIKIDNLHRDFQGLRIAQIADIHIGSIVNGEYLKVAEEAINEIKADILVVTGDIIDNLYYAKEAQEFFYRLSKSIPMGIHAVLGNHDFFVNPQLVSDTLTNANVNVIRNDVSLLKRGNGKLNLLGLDYPIFYRRQREKRMQMAKKFFYESLKKVNSQDPVILLNHHPDEFVFFREEKIDLVLAGHTHGGQVCFTKDRESPLSFGSNFYRYYKGYYFENGTHLYVNQGLGHWMPFRVNCPPEISVFELI
ncbi:MAG: metallophosphoesterase [Spirochaetia bacterium]|nr:metallophosphoesterase [Spirochaetia bacterium]